MPLRLFTIVLGLLWCLPAARAQTGAQVLLVVNQRSTASREIGEYYLRKRGIPLDNMCAIDTDTDEQATREQYVRAIEIPVSMCLTGHRLTESVLYIVLTKGVPLRIRGSNEDTMMSDAASVDSELTLLYQRLHGAVAPLPGSVPNPFFQQRTLRFRHPQVPMYMVTRLDGYTMADMKGMVDRSLEARNTGVFVIDLKAHDTTDGNQWLRNAASYLPKERVVLDDSAAVLSNVKRVIGYASWGSNDSNRQHRFLHMEWLPGAIATEFVSTNGRSFAQPPDNWEIRGAWSDQKTLFAGSPQSLTGDFIHEGASGASGQVFEPFLQFCPRPEFVLPAYFAGRNLAESFYMGIPALSWMNVVIGDPLMRLR